MKLWTLQQASQERVYFMYEQNETLENLENLYWNKLK